LHRNLESSVPRLLQAFNNINIKIYKNLSLIVVLYGCETGPLTSTLWKDHSLRVFEKSLVRVKIKQSRYRLEWPRGFQEVKIPGQDGGKVVSLTHRPPLPPGNVPGTHFC
jgi:hypothetical protein